MRALVETGALAGERGAYRLVDPAAIPRVPATVQAALASRIDRLPSDDKALLQSAAVIGKDIPYPLLRVIAERDVEALLRGLAQSQTAEFLYEASLFPELEYTFKPALTHEVAYGSVLQERRRALHARVMAAIETQAAGRLDEQVEGLAYHDFRGELWEQAAEYGRRAGLRALARNASGEAHTQFEGALAALDHLPDRRETRELAVDLPFLLSRALSSLGEREQRLAAVSRAAAAAEALGDPIRLARILGSLAFALDLTADGP